jgi:ADP-heptose:LPS heptosyltransferase/GT2 family glycosyltransferase
MPSLSVIILTRDRLKKLRRAIDRLAPQLGRGDEIVVVDTGSRDETPAWLRNVAPSIVHPHEFGGPGSWAEARNFALDRARGAFVAFLDDDCTPAPDWVARGRAALESADAVGGWVEPFGVTAWPEWWDPAMGWLVGVSVPGHRGPNAGSVHYPYTSNLWARAEALRAERFQELGGRFGEREGERYATGREDAEWWRRIRRAGYRTRFDAELRVDHDFGAERLKIDYLMERARRDGEAWARRQGIEEDLVPLAYQLLLTAIERAEADGIDPKNAQARKTWQRLMARRHRAAIDGLCNELAEADSGGPSATLRRQRAMRVAAMRRTRDRFKTIARRLVLAAAPTVRPPLPERPPQTLAVAAFGFLGDAVILQSALRGLIAAHPRLTLRVIGPASAAVALRGLERVEVTTQTDSPTPGPPERRLMKDWMEKSPRAEAIVAPYLHGAWGEAFIRLRRFPAPVVGFDRDQGFERQLLRERIPHRIEKDLTLHESRNLMRLFAAVGLEAEPQPPRLTPAAAALEAARTERERWIAESGAADWLMLNPDAGTPHKQWTDESWIELMGRLIDEFPHGLAINLSAPRADFEGAIGGLPEKARARVRLLRGASLEALIAHLSLCRGVITVDAGPQHLAHALGVPSLTLYGPMDERRWADAWSRPIHATVRGGNWDLTPEELRGLPANHIMRTLKPERVMERARQWIALPADAPTMRAGRGD